MTVAYEIGSVIEYRSMGGDLRTVKVDEKDSNIKNGRPGFAGELLDGTDCGMGVWGYDDQIVRVVR